MWPWACYCTDLFPLLRSGTATHKHTKSECQDIFTGFRFNICPTSILTRDYYPRFQAKCIKLWMCINAFNWRRVQKVHQILRKTKNHWLSQNFLLSTTLDAIYRRMVPKSTHPVNLCRPLYLRNQPLHWLLSTSNATDTLSVQTFNLFLAAVSLV